MTEKRFIEIVSTEKIVDTITNKEYSGLVDTDFINLVNESDKRIKELEKEVEYWKQVASQYSNESNIFEHCKKHKTECKDIYWDSD